MRTRIAFTALLLAVLVVPIAIASHLVVGGPAVVALLSGKQEMPVADPNGKGTATIHLNAKLHRVCWSFSYQKIAKPTAAHIHFGKKCVSGPVFIPLGAAFKAKGCTSAPRAAINAVLANPSSYYVNIHNLRYPNGAIRGQLHR